MTEKECIDKLTYLKEYDKCASFIVENKESPFYSDLLLKKTIAKTRREVVRLEELLYNGELSNSRSGEYEQ